MAKNKCKWCGARTRRLDLCQGCKSKNHHAHKRVAKEGLLVDLAGGSWWVWTAKGDVLVIGRDTKLDAYKALAIGDEVDDLDEAFA